MGLRSTLSSYNRKESFALRIFKLGTAIYIREILYKSNEKFNCMS